VIALAFSASTIAGCDVEPRPPEALGDNSPETRAASDSALVAEVTDVLERYAVATAERDTAAIRSFVLDDPRFVWFEEGEARYRSDDDILASLAMFPSDQSIDTTFDDVRVIPVGEGGAMAWSSYETVVRDGGGAEVLRFGGLILFVLERSEDGWRIVGGQAS
jgi:ketosteroid isomerase-like protein